MTTNEVEDRLARYVDELSATVDPISAAESMERSRSRGSGRWAAGAVAAATVLVALSLVGLSVLGGDDETQVATAPVEEDTDAAASDTPPSAELAPLSEDVELWLSATEVPPGDHEVVAALVAHRAVDATFGVHARVERWSGDGWTPAGEVVMCLRHWHCTSTIDTGSDGEVLVPLIGLGAVPGAPGHLERFTVAGLDEGWYRISQTANEGVVASGVLHVTAYAPAPVPLPPTDAPSIGVQPPIVGPDGSSPSLEPLVPMGAEGQSIEDVEAAVAGLAEEVLLQRWDGQVWATIDVLPLRRDDGGHLIGRSLDLPPLDPGAYRLVREGPDDPHVGNFWVADGLLPDAAVEDVPRAHEIRLDDPPLVARVELPPGLRQPPTPREPGTGPVYVENWLVPSTGGGVGISIQPDPGDDAPLFQLPGIARFETSLGSWIVVEIGESTWARPMAMLRHDGLVYQLSGGRPGDLSIVRSMAESLEVERLEP